MKILFSPSEAKSTQSSDVSVQKENFIFPELYEKRSLILNIYDDFVKNASKDELCRLFGLKEISQGLCESIFVKGCIKAILRYSGVAYTHLGYERLNQKARTYIDENTLIFSNLFGVVLASDLLPEYKLKQGQKLDSVNIEKFYKQNFSFAIDEFLKDEVVVDLRAEFYENFYELKQEFYTYKFIKNGKVVSHYAKVYRGKILRELAKNDVKNKNELMSMKFDEISLVDIKKIGYKNELLFEIC
ncbi:MULTISPECIES: YaaA family protein [unclassified Campylobacter]|uniref:YaaA family protein n=1 Tax=unclassified Campylobacter TaxID=2593542 RepID=UPI003D32EFF0